MRNVKNILMIAVIGSTLFASTGRVAALGGNPVFWNDYTAMYSFPHMLNNQNAAWTDAFSNVNAVWGETTKWGFGFDNENAHDVMNMYWGNGTMGAMFGLNLDNSGTDMAFGVDFGFGMPVEGVGDLGVTGGYADELDFGVNFAMPLNAWLFTDMVTSFNTSNTFSDMAFKADFYSMNEGDNGGAGVFAMGISSGGCTWCDDQAIGSDFSMNWTFGMETTMTDWATFRLGYTKSYDLMSQTGNPGMPTVGFGFDYGSFMLDMVVSTTTAANMMNNPVHYFWGKNTDALGSGFSISYIW